MEIHLTKHAGRRMKERLGIKSLSEKQRMAELAFARGKFVEFQEKERFGIMARSMVIEYQDHLFIFGKDLSLITVLPESKKHYETKRGLLSLVMAQEARSAIAYA